MNANGNYVAFDVREEFHIVIDIPFTEPKSKIVVRISVVRSKQYKCFSEMG